MREIKIRYVFRSPDEKIKTFILDISDIEGGVLCPWVTIDPALVARNQYTGLKDKSGKEIYEDDLCEDGHGDIYQIDWTGCGRRIAKCGAKPMACDIPRKIRETFEVIGNIYENPDLLK